MIQYIRGELAVVEADRVIVDVGGVGYGIFMPVESISQLPPVGNEVRIYTYLNVKEDAMQLFGFLTRDDLQVFKLCVRAYDDRRRRGYFLRRSVRSPERSCSGADSAWLQQYRGFKSCEENRNNRSNGCRSCIKTGFETDAVKDR